MTKDVRFVDTTLRDGEQTAGIAFSTYEKVTIAKLLDKAGLHVIEVGIPAMGREEQLAISTISGLGLNAQIMTWNRMNLEDIKASLNCGVNYIHISVPVSDIHIKLKLRKTREWILENLKKTIWFSKEKGCRVSVGAEDASRADYDFLNLFAKTARKEGAERLRFADTVGILDPFTAKERIKKLRQSTGIDIEIHAHNDFGLATANSLAAVQGGAKFISTTVNGIGERAGNAAMEEVVAVLERCYNSIVSFDKKVFPQLAEFVAIATNRQVPARMRLAGAT